MAYDIILGSNHHLDSSGIIKVRGKELFKIETAMVQDKLKPLVTVEIRDENGILLGKVYRSTSFVHHHPDYEPIIETEEGITKRLALKKRDGEYVFDLKFHDLNRLELNGVFHIQGVKIVATPNGLRLPRGNIIANSTFKCNKNDIKIT